ncbi:MAG: cell division/cell wall cluster transcriptional repressor MraZ [Armatimonadetes bacterium]|nr:cell division/cell wall cluster transcriptional repressor MraZ [Armatimonadota bacterium]
MSETPQAAARERTRWLLAESDTSIDAKGRVLFPKKFRDGLGEDFVILVGEHYQLILYPNQVFQEIVDEIQKYPRLSQGRQNYTREFTRDSEQGLEFDPQGRLVIPQKLRTVANLKGELKLMGQIDYLELWSSDEREEFEKDPHSYKPERRELLQAAYERMVSEGKDRG